MDTIGRKADCLDNARVDVDTVETRSFDEQHFFLRSFLDHNFLSGLCAQVDCGTRSCHQEFYAVETSCYCLSSSGQRSWSKQARDYYTSW